MLFVVVVLFYILYALSAPAWCYVLNTFAAFIALFKMACAIGTFIHGTDVDHSYDTKSKGERMVDD